MRRPSGPCSGSRDLDFTHGQSRVGSFGRATTGLQSIDELEARTALRQHRRISNGDRLDAARSKCVVPVMDAWWWLAGCGPISTEISIATVVIDDRRKDRRSRRTSWVSVLRGIYVVIPGHRDAGDASR